MISTIPGIKTLIDGKASARARLITAILEQGRGPGEASDETLVAAAREGDREAFGHLVTRYREAILGVCRELLGESGEDSEDATQETFVEALERLPDRGPLGPYSYWLYTLARERCRERLARARLESEARLEHARRSGPAGGVEEIELRSLLLMPSGTSSEAPGAPAAGEEPGRQAPAHSGRERCVVPARRRRAPTLPSGDRGIDQLLQPTGGVPG